MILDIFLDLTFVSKGGDQAIDLTVLEEGRRANSEVKDDNYLIGAARHLLQHTVEVNRPITVVYNKRRMNSRSHDCFLCFL